MNEREQGPVPMAEWVGDANCADKDPSIFFEGSQDEAKRICRSCQVSAVCLEYAIAYNLQGVWGGTSKRERDRIVRARGGTIDTETQ